MKIGLNATCFNNRPSGANQRFAGIYGALIQRCKDSEFVVFEPSDCRVGSWFGDAPNLTVKRTPIPSEGKIGKLKGLGYWRSVLADEHFDLFEGFNLPLTNVAPCRKLLTIHDIRRLRPQFRGWRRALYESVLERSLENATTVITVSESMRKEIKQFYPDVSVSVIYNGINTEAFVNLSEADLAQTSKKYALAEEFMLAVGHLEPRKNYHCLIEAIARLHSNGIKTPLVIVGNDSGEKEAINEKINSLHLKDHVKILSGISDLELRCLYKRCKLFVFPSAYEGFGIPILEAMAAGRPMVLSDIPVFREITQDQGIYFAHDNVDAMVHAIELGLVSTDERRRLAEYGRLRVLDFSFERLAHQLEQLHHSQT